MSQAQPSLKLREDLEVAASADGRSLVVIDDIAGRFARVPAALWQRLSGENLPSAFDQSDRAFWIQAQAAGWTQSREADRGRAWSLLSIRVPVCSLDRIASRLSGISGLLFSSVAILFWLVAGAATVVTFLVHRDTWLQTLPTLSQYLADIQLSTLALIFVVTKLIHELGHAVACRRIGSRVGVAGVWFLCGMPCPYVDVTQVWRQSNRFKRAGVMAAGMMCELILAGFAVWVWLIAGSDSLRMAAMNVVLVCGVSTLLFNANPLMRYDGYFILSDLLGSANLRQDARAAAGRLLRTPTARLIRASARDGFYSVYHLASLAYRYVLFASIAWLLLSQAARVGAFRGAAAVFVVAMVMTLRGWTRGRMQMIRGEAAWASVSWPRRLGLFGMNVLLIAMVFVPIPRYRHVQGMVRASKAIPVYLPASGVLAEVETTVGEHVWEQQRLAKIRDVELSLKAASVAGQSRILDARMDAARLISLQSNRVAFSPQSDGEHWDILQSANQATQERLHAIREREAELTVLSPIEGVVLPPEINRKLTSEDDVIVVTPDPMRLQPIVGQPVDNQSPWCRIAASGELEVRLVLTAADRNRVTTGSVARVTVDGLHDACVDCRVESVSPIVIHDAETSAIDQPDTYQVVCQLPNDHCVELESLPRFDGAACTAVLHLPRRALWEDIAAIIRTITGF